MLVDKLPQAAVREYDVSVGELANLGVVSSALLHRPLA